MFFYWMEEQNGIHSSHNDLIFIFLSQIIELLVCVRVYIFGTFGPRRNSLFITHFLMIKSLTYFSFFFSKKFINFFAHDITYRFGSSRLCWWCYTEHFDLLPQFYNLKKGTLIYFFNYCGTPLVACRTGIEMKFYNFLVSNPSWTMCEHSKKHFWTRRYSIVLFKRGKKIDKSYFKDYHILLVLLCEMIRHLWSI